MTRNQGWIGVDLDGTLAHYDSGNYEHLVIGSPIPEMISRVTAWLAKGILVKIVTARVSGPDSGEVESIIHEWSLKHIGIVLPVTCKKDYNMLELWDDRAVQVEMNTGKMIGYSTRNI